MSQKITAKATTEVKEEIDQPPKEVIQHIKTEMQQVTGAPPKNINVVVKHLWDDRFRVNVYWKPEINNEQLVRDAQMIHSHFLRATETEILSVDPEFCSFAIPEEKAEESQPMGKVR